MAHSKYSFQAIGNDAQRYDFIAAVLNRFVYRRLRRVDKGVVMRYLERTTGYLRQQLTRLVCRFLDGATLVERYCAPAQGFARKFTVADVRLLAQTDALHNTLSGPGHPMPHAARLRPVWRCPLCAAFHLVGPR